MCEIMEMKIDNYGIKINEKLIMTNTDLEKYFKINLRYVELDKGIDLHIFDEIGISIIKYTTCENSVIFGPLISYEIVVNINTNPNDNILYPKSNYKGKIIFFGYEINNDKNISMNEIITELKFETNDEVIEFVGIEYFRKKIDSKNIKIEIKNGNIIDRISVEYN